MEMIMSNLFRALVLSKARYLFWFGLGVFTAPLYAAEEDYGMSQLRLEKYSISALVGRASGDFSAGFDLTSRYIAVEEVPGFYYAWRYRANLAAKRTINILENTVKTFPYNYHRLGVSVTSKSAKMYRLYVDVDALLVYPNHYFSEYYALGAYFGAGVELYANALSKSAYYMEPGYYVSDGIAENVKGSPSYMNGVGLVLGWRYFWDF